MKLFILLFGISAFLFAQTETTRCFKEDWRNDSTIEQVPLYGNWCNNEKSLSDMKQEGWTIKDTKVFTTKNGKDYIYTLTKEFKIKDTFQSVNSTDTTKCFKESWTGDEKNLKGVPLDGGKCYSANSLEDMEKDGWTIKEKKIFPAESGNDYYYTFTKELTKEEIDKRENAVETTYCFKDSWMGDDKSIRKAPLDGGKCYSVNSLEDMEKEGWIIKEKKVMSAESGNDYVFILKKKVKKLTPVEAARQKRIKRIKAQKARNNTKCFKNDWPDDTPIEDEPLHGGECGNFKSLNDMKKEGWSVIKKIVAPAENGSDYIFLLRRK